MSVLMTAIKMLAIWEGTSVARENIERSSYYNQMREYADSVGKPLLMIGMPRWAWQPQEADVILDIDPNVESIAGGVQGDILNIPYPDKTFGGCYVAHVLEHMYSTEECEKAINECVRVSDRVAFLCPSPYSLISNLLMPSHHLRLWFDQSNNRIRVTDNRYHTGWGWHSYEASPAGIGNAMIVDTLPEIQRIGSTYII